MLFVLVFLGCSASSDGLVAPEGPVDELELPTLTGDGLPEFDRLIPALMERHNIPGASVSVMVNERLVMARGYGFADEGVPVLPATRFRIASLSKPITSIAMHALVESGQSRIRFWDSAFDYLQDLTDLQGLPPGGDLDRISINHLLYHTGGWDRDAAFDPMFKSVEAANYMLAASPGDAETIVRYMLRQPLQFEPGARFAYSNFGYAVLGRVIESVSGLPYEQYVRQTILEPAGAAEMRIGRSLVSTLGEARYYDSQGAPLARNVFDTSTQVRWPYGGFHLEAMDAHGGWTASSVDLLRVLSVVDGKPQRPDLISADSREAMLAHPGAHWGDAYYYSKGWERTPDSYFHTGALPGSSSYMGCKGQVCIAALFNSWPQTDSGYFEEVQNVLWGAADFHSEWPEGDLFSDY